MIGLLQLTVLLVAVFASDFFLKGPTGDERLDVDVPRLPDPMRTLTWGMRAVGNAVQLVRANADETHLDGLHLEVGRRHRLAKDDARG